MKKIWLLLIVLAIAAAIAGSVILGSGQPEHTHSLTKVDEKEATCTENGTEAYYTCSCEKLFADAKGEVEILEPKVIKKLGHSFINYAPNGDATCTADGTKTAKCERCKETDTQADVGSKKNHTYDQQNTELDKALKTEANCTDSAVYYKSCSCGAISDSETFTSGSPLGHSYTEAIEDADHLKDIASDCQNVNTYWYDCARCNANAKNDEGAGDKFFNSNIKGAHVWADAYTSADGNHYKTCKFGCEGAKNDFGPCSDVDTDDNHLCDVCNAAVGTHSYGEWVSEGENGHKKTCNCGDVQTEAHAWNETSRVPSTHLEEGKVDYSCECGATKTVIIGKLDDCAYNVEKVADKYLKSAATCTNAAVYYKSCICGEFSNAEDASTFEFGEPNGHSEETVPGYAAGCTSTGLTDGKKCTVCGVTTVPQKEISALDHKYDNDKDTDCNACGETRIVKLTIPNNSASELLYLSNTGYIEIDRANNSEGARVSMFETGVDHVVFYVYESADAAKEDYVARFILRGTPESIGKVDFTSVDGTISANVVQGQNGNFYIYKPDYNTFYNFLRDIIGYDYSYGQTYYFAAQAVAAEGTNYESSEISEIGANGFARDASKGNERYTVTVSGGLIDGSLETVTAGYGVELTLNTIVEDGKVFKGWYLTDAEGNEIGETLSAEMTYTVMVTANASYKAVFVTETTKLATPDNSASKLLYYANSNYIEIDRATNAANERVTMFGNGVDHVVFYVYESADAAKEDYVARFILRGTPESIGKVDFTSVDGTISANVVQGNNGNFYIYKADYNTFYNFLRDLIGYDYSYGQTYYFAAQAIAAEGTAYEDSDISEIGANGFARDASKGNERYTVTVTDGLIDGSLTSVTAGYGVELTLSTEAPDGQFFKGWYLTDAEGNEIGEAISGDLTYTFSVNGSASYKPVFASAKTKLETINNTNNEMITFVKTNKTFYIEFDRHKNADGTPNTVYDAGVDYVRYYMYRDFEGEKQLVSWFDVTKDGYIIDYNGNKNDQKLEGEPGNFYSKMKNGTWHNAIKASYNQGAAANGLTVTWDDNNVVYFACQARTNNTDSFEHGEIGTMGKGWGTI